MDFKSQAGLVQIIMLVHLERLAEMDSSTGGYGSVIASLPPGSDLMRLHARYALVDHSSAAFVRFLDHAATGIPGYGAFREATELAPHAYCLKRRLNMASWALLAAAPRHHNVHSIATHFGFTELGRFAERYRGFFGESPSHSPASTKKHHPAGHPKFARQTSSASLHAHPEMDSQTPGIACTTSYFSHSPRKQAPEPTMQTDNPEARRPPNYQPRELDA